MMNCSIFIGRIGIFKTELKRKVAVKAGEGGRVAASVKVCPSVSDNIFSMLVSFLVTLRR